MEPKNPLSGFAIHFPEMTHSDWVLSKRAKCTYVIRCEDRHYLYKVTSVWKKWGEGKVEETGDEGLPLGTALDWHRCTAH